MRRSGWPELASASLGLLRLGGWEHRLLTGQHEPGTAPWMREHCRTAPTLLLGT